MPKHLKIALPVKNRLCHSDQELSKSGRASKSHQWFQSYGHFTEWVDFAYWWSFIGGGSAPSACAAGLFYQHYKDLKEEMESCKSLT